MDDEPIYMDLDEDLMARAMMTCSYDYLNAVDLDPGPDPSNPFAPRDLATSTDENFTAWIDREGLLDGCRVDPRVELRLEQQPIGRGAFSVLYRAQYRAQGIAPPQGVAVKCIQNRPQHSKGFPMEVLWSREVAALALLAPHSHPNIVRLIGACREANTFLVVMELIPGGSMYQLLHATQTPLDLRVRLALLLEIANGMLFLHSQRVMHRDLTSENVLLTSTGHPKIIDFGFALMVSDDVENLDEEGLKLRPTGNARWRAPEITARLKYGPAVDVYSFGVIINETLSREVPFHGMKSADAAQAAVAGKRPRFRFELPALISFINAVWQPEASRRPSFDQIFEWINALYEQISRK